MSLYEVAFSGELMPGFEDARVRANMAKLFSADAKRIAALFSGRRIVIKSGLDKAAAQKYQLVLARAGAKVQIAVVGAAQPAAAPAAAAAPAPAPAPKAKPAAAAQPAVERPAMPATDNLPELKVDARDEYMAAFQSVSAPDFGLAATGDDLQDDYRDFKEAALDLSGMSLAPAGADMNQLKDEHKAVVPDTSHIKLAD